MAIKKQEFYEGAALHQLVRSGMIKSLTYAQPFFTVNDGVRVLLKYSTRGRSPWGFTFTPEEQRALQQSSSGGRTVVGLICGADGIASFAYEAYRIIAANRDVAIHISCYRGHREHYEVNGPDGILDAKVAPSDWLRILEL
jgi:hypothetical protein